MAKFNYKNSIIGVTNMRFCSIASSSSGNALYLEEGDTKILIDAGLSGKRVEEGLKALGVEPINLSAIVVTHEHIDHIKGVGVLSRRFNLPVYATETTWSNLEQIGQVKEENRCIIDKGKPIEFSELTLEGFSTSHDAVDPIGLTFFNQKTKGAIITDTGKLTSSMLNNLVDADFLFCEANHDEKMVVDGRYPWPLKRRVLGEKGHLSNTDLAKGLAQVLTKDSTQVILGHLSEENNTPKLALATVSTSLTEAGFTIGQDVHINTAAKSNISCCYSYD
jgi:phosphoribosyl 1,2-cyclic phosphodiesterase